MAISKTNLAVVVWVLLVGVFAALMLTANASPPNTTMKSLGTVLQVKDCQGGKHSHSCKVITTSHQWVTDLGNWPGEILQKGDQLAMRTDDWGSKSESWMCRNGFCRAVTLCWRWMPCWDKNKSSSGIKP